MRNRLAGQRHHDNPLELDLVTELFEKWQEHIIDDQKPITRVIGDIGNVYRRESQIQRVQDAAGHDRTKLGFEVRVVIPHQRRDTVAAIEAVYSHLRSVRINDPLWAAGRT